MRGQFLKKMILHKLKMCVSVEKLRGPPYVVREIFINLFLFAIPLIDEWLPKTYVIVNF